MIKILLSNPEHPEISPVSCSFPIENYAETYKDLEAITIGSATARDCSVNEISGGYPILERLLGATINVDEMDYLVKRLESFDKQEVAQFQGVAISQDINDVVDFINLTFCCQSATVVRDFTDLDIIGKAHYMDVHGGVTEDELKAIDFSKVAFSLIHNEDGKVTPFGVVYENDFEMEQLYDGRHFPEYHYSDSALTVAMTNSREKAYSCSTTYLYLPMEECQIERAMLRAGISTYENIQLSIQSSELPVELDQILPCGGESIKELNSLCAGYQALDAHNRQKFRAAIQMAAPSELAEAVNLIKQLDLFDFISGVSNPEEYGRYMIVESSHFQYDEELDGFYDFKKYGDRRIASEQGQFTPAGYISYHGFISIEEVLSGSETERMEQMMGGL